jgi:hypothetical protein
MFFSLFVRSFILFCSTRRGSWDGDKSENQKSNQYIQSDFFGSIYRVLPMFVTNSDETLSLSIYILIVFSSSLIKPTAVSFRLWLSPFSSPNWDYSVALDEAHEMEINLKTKKAINTYSQTSLAAFTAYLPYRAETMHSLKSQLGLEMHFADPSPYF